MPRIGGDECIALLSGCEERVAAGLQERIQSMIKNKTCFYEEAKLERRRN